MGHIRPFLFLFKRIVCCVIGHRWIDEQRHRILYTGCKRCRQLKEFKQLHYTVRRKKTFGDIERWMASNPPEGYNFVECNWKKRKAKFVTPTGHLKFLGF